MKILYFGSFCEDEWFKLNSQKKKNPAQVAQYSFEKALIKGILENGKVDLQLNYIFLEAYYPKGDFLVFGDFKKKTSNNIKYLKLINLPLLKELSLFGQGVLSTSKWAIANFKNKEKIILTAYNYTPLSLGIYLAAKIFRIKRCNVFTDLSTDVLNVNRQKDMHFLKKNLIPIYLKIVRCVEKRFDKYILFTDAMNEKVNLKNKPNLVIEGIYNNDLDLSNKEKSRAIMYAGTLAAQYGVKNILDAFELIEDPTIELWIFGDGDLKEYILMLSNTDKRIKYYGFKSREEVFEYEKKATLLINARNPNDTYTKYSFPSKTFEYMVSGTPFLTTILECIPKEYYDYLYLVDTSEIEKLKSKIEEIFNQDSLILDTKGQNARDFILKKKNSKVQSEKIVNFLFSDIKK